MRNEGEGRVQRDSKVLSLDDLESKMGLRRSRCGGRYWGQCSVGDSGDTHIEMSRKKE